MPVLTTSAASSSWSAERSSLVADALRGSGPPGQDVFQTVRLRVYGESMLPALWPGDFVEITPCQPQDVRPGEIVLAFRDGRLFLHRLVTPCTPTGFQLRGDSMPGIDPDFPLEALLGRLVGRIEAGSIASSPALALRPGVAATLSRVLGILFCHFGPARRLALKLHRRRAFAAEFYSSASIVEPEAS